MQKPNDGEIVCLGCGPKKEKMRKLELERRLKEKEQ